MEPLFDLNQTALRALLTDAAERAAHAIARELPRPDPQYTIGEVAKLLALDASTVRAYLELPVTHLRHLPATRCTDSGRGNRIRLSQVLAWQTRNTLAGPTGSAEAEATEPESLMAISHRRAARRQGRQQMKAAA